MLAAGGVAAYAMPGTATAQPRSPFSVSPTFIPIAGSSELFPVRRIYCIGRNYAAHSRAMGSEPTRTTSYPMLCDMYPSLPFLISAPHMGGKDIAIERALQHFFDGNAASAL